MKATTVIDYIVQRLADEGIEHCFGVPGDYALRYPPYDHNRILREIVMPA
jgi:TPP-dependent 2-oxoacid decarboxylase